VDEAGRCGRHTDAVEREGDDEVLSRLAAALFADLIGIHHTTESVSHQHDVGRFDGDVRACADGDADVGLREGGCVIDAVPDHRHAVTVILETPNLLALFVG